MFFVTFLFFVQKLWLNVFFSQHHHLALSPFLNNSYTHTHTHTSARAHAQIIYIYVPLKLTDIGWPSKIVLPSHSIKTTITRQCWPCAKLTPATIVAVDRSVVQSTTNYIYEITQKMYMYKICFITLLITTMFSSL